MRTLMVLFLLLPTLAGAQVDYFANDPVWRVASVCNESGMGGGPCIATDDHQYILSGDTLIGGTTYKRTLRSGSISPMWTGQGPAPVGCTITTNYGPELSKPIRQEGRALYVWNGDADQLLFDFDMQVGELLPLSFNNYDPNIEVTDLDSIQLNGEWRRVFTVNGGWVQTIVEGIGSDKGLFEPISTEFECGYSFTCFGLNGISVYPGPECNIVMALPESEKPRIDVRFNAVTSMLTVVLPGGTQAMPVEVMDLNGRSIRQTGLSGTGGQIALPGIASGTYMLRIGTRTERFVVGN